MSKVRSWSKLILNSKRAALGSVCTITSPFSSDVGFAQSSEPLPYVTPKDLDSPFVRDAARHTAIGGEGAESAAFAESGSVLVGVQTTLLDRSLPLSVAARPVAISREVRSIVLPEDSIDPQYLYWFLRARSAKIIKDGVYTRGLSRTLDPKTLEELEIPLPSLLDQRAIVALLTRAQHVIELNQKADSGTSELIAAIFSSIFGNVRSNSAWRVESLGGLSIGDPKYGLRLTSDSPSSNAIRCIRVGDVTPRGDLKSEPSALVDDFGEEDLLKDGDILFVRSGRTVGKTLLFLPHYGVSTFASYLVRFRLDRGRITPEYLFGLTRTPYYKDWVRRTSHGVAQPNISSREFASLAVPLPPMHLQVKFAKRFVQVRQAQLLIQKQAEAARNLPTALLNRVFAEC